MFSTYAKHANVTNQYLIQVFNIIDIHIIIDVNHKWSLITTFGCGGQSSLIFEGVMEIWINMHLARGNLTTRRTHYPQDLTFDYLSLSPSEVKIAPLHLGWNIGSTVCAWPWHHPRLPHSSSDNHHRVGVMVWPTRVLNQHRLGLPPRSPEYLLIHSHPSHLVILHLQSLSFLDQS
jgi:hypothetical protein